MPINETFDSIGGAFDVEGFDGYKVNKLGDVFSEWVQTHKNGVKGFVTVKGKWHKLIPSTKGKYGHQRMTLSKDGRTYYFLVHRLVATAFIKNTNNNKLVCHKDGNPANNNVDNLYWGSYQNNANDCKKHGRALIGETTNSVKLNEQKVKLIRLLRKDFKWEYKKIASLFGVCVSNIEYIIYNKTWKHVN